MIHPERHRAVSARTWNADEARAAIEEIAADAVSAIHPEYFWPPHPLDDDTKSAPCLYLGAAGVVWALDHLARNGVAAAAHDFRPALPALVERSRRWLASGPAAPFGRFGSLLMGDLGALLVSMRLDPSSETADRIHARAKDNDALPVAELMWGTPGSMIVCLHVLAMTGEERFAALYREQAGRLLADMPDDGLWTQTMYGVPTRYVGAVHGFAGNMAALINGWALLSETQRGVVQDATCRTLAAQAVEDGDGANWPASAAPNPPIVLCQHCHGAPGMVTSLAEAPFSTAEFEHLLLEGGRTIWKAGPLAKGSNLCHGTAGNGYAFLKLYRRTREAVWLERAQRFAMTAIEQVREARMQYGQGRYSLWTGDAGVAVYLLDCIRGEARFPTIDGF
jgi:hypothetical protein